MKKRLLASAFGGALFGMASASFAQQPPAVAPATCSEQAASCKSGCGSADAHNRQCLLGCETNLVECKATGFWKSAGQKLPRRKE